MIKALFLDVGGVLLSNGWDTKSRIEAAKTFGYNFDEMEKLHQEFYGSYEEGRISLEEYLDQVLFYKERPFSPEEFAAFIYSQSHRQPKMIDFFLSLKNKYRLKVAALSNEGVDLTLFRVSKFKLNDLMDFFIFSCFVHVRKPSPEIFQIAVNTALIPKEQILFIDDREGHVAAAKAFGLNAIHHKGYEETKGALEEFGLL